MTVTSAIQLLVNGYGSGVIDVLEHRDLVITRGGCWDHENPGSERSCGRKKYRRTAVAIKRIYSKQDRLWINRIPVSLPICN
jgi:hypothetical protein